MTLASQTYTELMALCGSDDAFFFKDCEKDGISYRIFNYRLVSYTQFQKPSALNCRGIMYDVTDPTAPRLVSLPMQKFFNYEEGGVDHSAHQIGCIMEKMDGSLISTYIHQGELAFKSKGSLTSSQAISATKYVNDRPALKDAILDGVSKGFTLNFEYTSPENRVVVPYQDERLTLLSARCNSTFENYFGSALTRFQGLVPYIVEPQDGCTISHRELVESVRARTEGEGVVVEIGERLVKIKSDRYLLLHQTKDSVNSSKRLFEAIIEEATDDLRSLFADDPYVLAKIAAMEAKVQPIFNHIVNTVETFYETNKSLTRKDFAIKVQAEFPQFMGMIMGLFTGRTPDYKTFAKKYRVEIFGICDDQPETE